MYLIMEGVIPVFMIPDDHLWVQETKMLLPGRLCNHFILKGAENEKTLTYKYLQPPSTGEAGISYGDDMDKVCF